MTNTVYYDIFETDTHVEYHVSSVKQEVIDRQSMSRRTTIDNPKKAELVAEWQEDADFHRCVKIDETEQEADKARRDRQIARNAAYREAYLKTVQYPDFS